MTDHDFDWTPGDFGRQIIDPTTATTENTMPTTPGASLQIGVEAAARAELQAMTERDFLSALAAALRELAEAAAADRGGPTHMAAIDRHLMVEGERRRRERLARAEAARAAAALPAEDRTRDAYGYAIGDRVTGRDVSGGSTFTGTIAEIIDRPWGCTGNRYVLTDTGMTYAGGEPVEPTIEDHPHPVDGIYRAAR